MSLIIYFISAFCFSYGSLGVILVPKARVYRVAMALGLIGLFVAVGLSVGAAT
jgi:hypothetical protein